MDRKHLDRLVGSEVYISEPRQVVRVGYEHDLNTELLLMAKESGYPNPPTNLIETLSWRNQLIEGIFDNHPLAAPYREHTQALHRLPYTPDGNLVNMSRGIIINMAKHRIRQRELNNLERALHFAPLPQEYMEYLQVPWKITAAKIVTTGHYIPGSRCRDPEDCESATLADQRKHVLYECAPASFRAQLSPLWILAKDTMDMYEHRKAETVAKRLMQFP